MNTELSPEPLWCAVYAKLHHVWAMTGSPPKKQMHREDLMNPDMLSEILLLVSGSVIFVTLLLILAAALTQTAALR